MKEIISKWTVNYKGHNLAITSNKEVYDVNYPPTAKPMGWASWVKAPDNSGNVP